MGVAMAAERGQARSVADVVADHDAFQVTVVNQAADRPEPLGVVWHVDVGVPIETPLLPKQIKFDDATGIGQLEKLALIKDRPIDVTDNDTIDGATVCRYEYLYLLRLL